MTHRQERRDEGSRAQRRRPEDAAAEELGGRVSGGGYAGSEHRAPEGSGFGRADNELGADFGGNYARSGGTNIYHSDYTAGETETVDDHGEKGPAVRDERPKE